MRIARQVAEGLAAAHAKGVIHRDLKPANILLDAQGNAYISDFGVARSLATSGQTRTGTVVGTPDYLAPEQARGDRVDARSDLYALGLILYEMLDRRAAVRRRHRRRSPRAAHAAHARPGDTPARGQKREFFDLFNQAAANAVEISQRADRAPERLPGACGRADARHQGARARTATGSPTSSST